MLKYNKTILFYSITSIICLQYFYIFQQFNHLILSSKITPAPPRDISKILHPQKPTFPPAPSRTPPARHRPSPLGGAPGDAVVVVGGTGGSSRDL